MERYGPPGAGAHTVYTRFLTHRDRYQAQVLAPAAEFASTEGLVGRSEPGGAVLTFATDMCIVELVDRENRSLASDAASTRVLVTNLHNLTQPLIRYELTDCLVRYPCLPGSGYLRAEWRDAGMRYFGTVRSRSIRW